MCQTKLILLNDDKEIDMVKYLRRAIHKEKKYVNRQIFMEN